jgi:hypothetical protein
MAARFAKLDCLYSQFYSCLVVCRAGQRDACCEGRLETGATSSWLWTELPSNGLVLGDQTSAEEISPRLLLVSALIVPVVADSLLRSRVLSKRGAGSEKGQFDLPPKKWTGLSCF